MKSGCYFCHEEQKYDSGLDVDQLMGDIFLLWNERR